MGAARSIPADATVATIERPVAQRETALRHLRCDHGPEMTAHASRDCCRLADTGTSYIEPDAVGEGVGGVSVISGYRTNLVESVIAGRRIARGTGLSRQAVRRYIEADGLKPGGPELGEGQIARLALSSTRHGRRRSLVSICWHRGRSRSRAG